MYTMSFSRHEICDEAGMYRESKLLQIYLEITLSFCPSREALLLAMDRD